MISNGTYRLTFSSVSDADTRALIEQVYISAWKSLAAADARSLVDQASRSSKAHELQTTTAQFNDVQTKLKQATSKEIERLKSELEQAKAAQFHNGSAPPER
jgi:isocitrate lyase